MGFIEETFWSVLEWLAGLVGWFTVGLAIGGGIAVGFWIAR